ncbi:MAG: tetratricopeptide repeat-containing protein, partial [Balneolaceae bacterium]|nr:tetratricopeptide repeat-containing protein [Balneolaceae bacterium]
ASGSQANQIKQQVNTLRQRTQQLQKEIGSLTDNAIAELETVLEYRPDDASAYNTLGIIYQNKASALFEERNQTTDNQKAAALDKQAREQLRQAMNYYEKAASIDPDNKEYWQSLYRVYVALGMDEKAKEAEKKAGL